METRKKLFKVKLENVFVGATEERAVKSKEGDVIGSRYLVRIEWRAGYILIGVEQSLIEKFPGVDDMVNVFMLMEPELTASHIAWTDKKTGQKKEADFVEGGFTGFRYVGFEPVKK